MNNNEAFLPVLMFHLLFISVWASVRTAPCLKYPNVLKGRCQSYCDIFLHREDPCHTYTQEQTARITCSSRRCGANNE